MRSFVSLPPSVDRRFAFGSGEGPGVGFGGIEEVGGLETGVGEGAQFGVVEITVLPDALQPLHEALEQLGWQVVA